MYNYQIIDSVYYSALNLCHITDIRLHEIHSNLVYVTIVYHIMVNDIGI